MIFQKLDFSKFKLFQIKNTEPYKTEDWSLIREMIEKAREKSGARITAKIRIMDSEEVTIRYAKMIQSSGVSLLTVHGRTRSGFLRFLRMLEF